MSGRYSRKKFIHNCLGSGIMFGILKSSNIPDSAKIKPHIGKRVGIIGADTSHSTAFAKALNNPEFPGEYSEYRVTVVYPQGSFDIESSKNRIPEYMEELQSYGVKKTASIEELIKEADVILLETNDGRLHVEQAIPVLKAGKKMFIDKPLAASLKDVIRLFDLSKKYQTPLFSSSSLRYLAKAQQIRQDKMGLVLGADTYSPAKIEKTHPDLFWYGIHGVELLFTIMGSGCSRVSRYSTSDTDIVTGFWDKNRIGTFRGTRRGTQEYGGTVFMENGNIILGNFEGYKPLLIEIIKFFETGIPPVSAEETIRIYAFMVAADESKRKKGRPVNIESVISKARKHL